MMQLGMTVHDKEIRKYKTRKTEPMEFKTGQERRRERRAKARK